MNFESYRRESLSGGQKMALIGLLDHEIKKKEAVLSDLKEGGIKDNREKEIESAIKDKQEAIDYLNGLPTEGEEAAFMGYLKAYTEAAIKKTEAELAEHYANEWRETEAQAKEAKRLERLLSELTAIGKGKPGAAL